MRLVFSRSFPYLKAAWVILWMTGAACVFTQNHAAGQTFAYPIIDTGQTACYDLNVAIPAPSPEQEFYGQDAQFMGNQPSYKLTFAGGGLCVVDQVTGLTWQACADLDSNSQIDAQDKMTWAQAQAYVASLNGSAFGGYTDWRLPSIKELYSLILFTGTDPSGYEGTDTSGLTPFIDTGYFIFGYGDTSAGERIIDAQYASSTLYVSTTGGGEQTLFGVNFADGRIKGYGLTVFGADKTFYVLCVRGAAYGQNDFVDNGDGTVTDRATGLMWMQDDSGVGYNWSQALNYAQTKSFAGCSDWRLPNAKELQSLVDYTRSPATHAAAAIDPLFTCTPITNEAGQADFPCYWTSTTHASYNGMGANAVYVAFGRAMGYVNSTWVDIHGAGAQRSDPKAGDPADYPTGRGPQGDAIRIYNYVRLVRTAADPRDNRAASCWTVYP